MKTRAFLTRGFAISGQLLRNQLCFRCSYCWALCELLSPSLRPKYPSATPSGQLHGTMITTAETAKIIVVVSGTCKRGWRKGVSLICSDLL